MLYIAGINYESFNEAPGVSCVIFISGCTKNCLGCHNPQTHNFKYGKPLTKELINEINNEINKRPYLNYLVLSGGDPMESAKEICETLLPYISVPKNNLWCYTGFTMNEILEDKNKINLLSYCNGLTDGRFELEKRDTTLCFRGSSNQNIWKKDKEGIWHVEN